MANRFLGEFEQVVLLAILQMRERAFGLEIRREIEASAQRSVSRGAFYTTLDRMEKKGYLVWTEEIPNDPARKAPLRRFSVTPEGFRALRASHRAISTLSRGLGEILEDA
jgi:DNA-binding PadR family transcriptional regulator